MKYIKLLWFDIKNGLIKNKLFIISVSILSILFCFDFSNKIVQTLGRDANYTFGDVLMYIYGGMKEYIPSPENRFEFPALWIILFSALLFGTLNYPYNNLHTFGKHILIRTKGRSLWWLSKCGWNVVYTLLFHTFIFIIVLSFSIISKAEVSIDINSTLAMNIFGVPEEKSNIQESIIPFSILISPILLSISMNLLQMTLSLFIKPIFSFLSLSIILLSSSYLMSPLMVGNYAMTIRSDMILKNGVNFNVGIIVSLIMFIISIICGLVRFHFYDIINNQEA